MQAAHVVEWTRLGGGFDRHHLLASEPRSSCKGVAVVAFCCEVGAVLVQLIRAAAVVGKDSYHLAGPVHIKLLLPRTLLLSVSLLILRGRRVVAPRGVSRVVVVVVTLDVRSEHLVRRGLQLLQRIRDEAHRVANGYNELLLRRRISESALDEVPGVSETRKKALLATFGSIARIRKATAEQLGMTPGISLNLAESILEILNQKPLRSAAEKRSSRLENHG